MNNTNEILVAIHKQAVEKVSAKTIQDGKNLEALRIGSALMEYGRLWVDSFKDDGTITDEEKNALNTKFEELSKEYIPAIEGTTVSIAWNGISFLGIGWKGLKSYINKLFGFNL
jgi:hypothetical protein